MKVTRKVKGEEEEKEEEESAAQFF